MTAGAFIQSEADILTTEDFRRIATIASADAGLLLPESKRLMVQSRLVRRMRQLGCASLEEYLDMLSDEGAGTERQHLVSVLTTNVTSFFREAHHFDALRTKVLPRLIDRARTGERVRLWSAGCSSGQEPYSLAISISAIEPRAHELDIRILATDIDESVLEKARGGSYTTHELEALPQSYRRLLNDGSIDGDRIVLSDSIRRLVTFRRLNLHSDWPMRGQFDVIMCRNVLIYFAPQHQAALWPRFHASLAPDGWLFLGHSERIHPLDGSGFAANGVTTYRKSGWPGQTDVGANAWH